MEPSEHRRKAGWARVTGTPGCTIAALACGAAAPLGSVVIVKAWLPWMGGASGFNAGPAALVSFSLFVVWLGLSVALAVPGIVLSIIALRKPPRTLAIGALAVNLILPTWLLSLVLRW